MKIFQKFFTGASRGIHQLNSFQLKHWSIVVVNVDFVVNVDVVVIVVNKHDNLNLHRANNNVNNLI